MLAVIEQALRRIGPDGSSSHKPGPTLCPSLHRKTKTQQLFQTHPPEAIVVIIRIIKCPFDYLDERTAGLLHGNIFLILLHGRKQRLQLKTMCFLAWFAWRNAQFVHVIITPFYLFYLWYLWHFAFSNIVVCMFFFYWWTQRQPCST